MLCWWEYKPPYSEKKKRDLYDLATLPVDIYVRKSKTCFEEDICTPHGHYSIIFTIDKIWKKWCAGVQPQWIQGDLKVGTESASWKKLI